MEGLLVSTFASRDKQNLHEWKVEGALEEVLVLLTCVQYYRLVARRQDALDTDGEMTIL